MINITNDILTLIIILVTCTMAIIILSLNILFSKFSRILYRLNLYLRIINGTLSDDDFYLTLYYILQKSYYDEKNKKYIIDKNKFFNIVKNIEKLPNTPVSNMILNERFRFFKEMKILLKKDQETLEISKDFNNLNKTIHCKIGDDNLV